MNVAGQLDRYTDGDSLFIDKGFTSMLASKQGWDSQANFSAYNIACLFTAFLIEKYTLNKVLELISKTKRNYYEPHFQELVLQLFNHSIFDLEKEFASSLNKTS